MRLKRKHAGGQKSAKGARWRIASLWPFVFVAAATGLVYANSLHNEFLFDDLEVIVEMRSKGSSGPFAPLLGLFTTGRAYRPIRTASYAFDYSISGLDPWGYHVSNIVLHALAACFVFLIAKSLLGGRLVALFTSLLFAVHPIQTDAVTYLSGRRDVLAGLFVLAGFYEFLRYRETGRARHLALAGLLYPMAFFSKESGIVLPLFVVAYDIVRQTRITAPVFNRAFPAQLWAGVRNGIGRSPLLYLGLVVAAASLASYVLFIMRGTPQREYYGGSLWFTLLTDARIFVHYLKLLIFPVTLNADYSYNAFPVTTSWTDPRALASVLLLSAIAVGLLALLKDRPIAAFGGLWFFLGLLPVAHIIPHHEIMAEHYLYLPSVGFFLFIGALLEPLAAGRRFGLPVYIAASVVVVLLGLRTVWRNRDWKDDLTLWTKTVEVAPQAARVRNNLGAAYLRRGQGAHAREQLEEALRIAPNSPYARANLGKVYLDSGDLASAERELDAALRITRRDAIPLLWLGGVYAQGGRTADAERTFRKALSRGRVNAFAHNNLGALFVRSGRLREAEQAFRDALRIQPGLREARENLIKLYLLEGRLDEAEQMIQAGLAARPQDAMMHYFLGVVYRSRGAEGLAARALTTALSLDPNLAAARQALDQLRGGSAR